MIENVGIGKKIMGISLILIGFSVIVGLFSLRMIDKVQATDGLHASFDRLEILALNMRRTEKDFLLRERTGEEFLSTGISSYLRENAKARDVTLSAQDLAELDAAFPRPAAGSFDMWD